MFVAHQGLTQVKLAGLKGVNHEGTLSMYLVTRVIVNWLE
jgi:hypothetical protein